MLEGQLRSLNRPNAMLYDLSSGGKLERLLLHHFFVAFSEREPFFRGFPCGSFGLFLVPKLYLGVKKMCKKFREIPTVGLDLYRGTLLTTPPNRAMDSPMMEWCYHIYSMVKNHLDQLNGFWTS